MNGIPEQPSPLRKASRLRRIGLVVLLLGFICAGGVYWQGHKSAVPPDDSDSRVTVDDSKRIAHNGQLLYGKTAWALMGLLDDLMRPTGLAILIATASSVGSFACFHLARVAEERG